MGPFSRNHGLVQAETQTALQDATVLVAGVGGIGGRCAEVLARLGLGALRLADPDVFTTTNLNRQAGCTRTTLGMKKTAAVAALCIDISSTIVVETDEDGITGDNLPDLLDGVDVVVDGTDYTQPDLGLRLARAARRRGIPVVIGVEVGFGAWVSTFPGRDEPAFERLFGLPRGVETTDLEIPLWRWVGLPPRYLPREVLRAIERGELEAPAIAPAVELVAAMTSSAVLDLVAGRPTIEAPRVRHLDVRTGRSRTYRPRRWRFSLGH